MAVCDGEDGSSWRLPYFQEGNGGERRAADGEICSVVAPLDRQVSR